MHQHNCHRYWKDKILRFRSEGELFENDKIIHERSSKWVIEEIR